MRAAGIKIEITTVVTECLVIYLENYPTIFQDIVERWSISGAQTAENDIASIFTRGSRSITIKILLTGAAAGNIPSRPLWPPTATRKRKRDSLVSIQVQTVRGCITR